MDLGSPPRVSFEPVNNRTWLTSSFSSLMAPFPIFQSPLTFSHLVSVSSPPSASVDDIEDVNSLLYWAFKDLDMKNADKSLVSKPISATKYMDEQILRELGIHDAVFAYLDVVNWTEFARIREPVYEDLTLEFLSFLRLNFKPGVPRHRDMIYFRCVSVDRELDMGSMSVIFGFKDDGYK